MKKIALLIGLVLLAGCKTKPLAVSPTFSRQTFPQVDSTSTVGIGEQMLTQGDAITTDAIVLTKNATFGEITVEAGTYPLAVENEEYKQFQHVRVFKRGRQLNHGKLYVFKKGEEAEKLCISRKACKAVEFSIGKTTTYSRASSQQTLIYSGKIGNRITLGYREFVNEIARPAFSNDVNYDLSESTILGYKGARVQVISATNTEITYKILAGFN